MDARNELLEEIRPVVDPEIGYSIVDMGLIYNSYVEDGTAYVLMTLTSPACPYAPELIKDVEKTLNNAGYDQVKLQIATKPAWNPEMMTDDLKLELGIPV